MLSLYDDSDDCIDVDRNESGLLSSAAPHVWLDKAICS